MIFVSLLNSNRDEMDAAMSDLSREAYKTMYPCSVYPIASGFEGFTGGAYSYYGTVMQGHVTFTVNERKYRIEQGQFFAFSSNTGIDAVASRNARGFAIQRLGYRVPNVVGEIEHRGRLQYIDGCSDSMLVQPARKGDPVLNLLYFPPQVEQTFHTHPSIRLGVVLSGKGFATNDGGETELAPGTVFLLPEQERHRFRTEGSDLRIMAFHPDSDWGPEDANHPMLNRTYIR